MLPDKLYYHMTAELGFRSLKVNTILPDEQRTIYLYKEPYKIGDIRLIIAARKLALSHPVSEYQLNVYKVNSVSIPELNQFVETIEVDRNSSEPEIVEAIRRLAIQKGLNVKYYT